MPAIALATYAALPNLAADEEHALRSAPGESLYARVDGVLLDRKLVVTEVELLEPSLFLDVVPEAPRALRRRDRQCHSERA